MAFPFTPLYVLLLAVSYTLAGGIAEILAQTPELSGLNGVLTTEHPEFLGALNGTSGTFFAPSNEAMSAFMASVDPDTFDPSVIKDLIAYHLLPAKLSSKDLSVPGGVISETMLTSPSYANLDSGKPNVVFSSAYGSAGLDATQGPLKVYSGVGNAAAVVKADIQYDGGFVHVIDLVLNLPQPGTKTLEAAGLKVALEFIQQTGLTNLYDDTPKLTSFAPSDEAFKAAGIDFSAMTPEHAVMALKYHIVVGDVGYSTALEDGKQYQTLLGVPVTVYKKDGQLWVNDSPVQQANIVAKNGVVHVLGAVLAPPGDPSHS